MSKAPSMPMYWDAYIADTTHLTTLEHGAYMLLLGAMWRRNGWVPDDEKDLARILGLTVGKWKRVRERLSPFLMFENGEISQKNLLKIWKNTQEKIAKNKENGAKGGRAAAIKNNDLGQANATETLKPNATIPEPEPEPEEKRDTNVSPKKPVRRAMSLPDDWVPSEKNIQDAHAKDFTDLEIQNEADKFRDYHLAKGTTFKDWDAGWRTWLRNTRKFSANSRVVVGAFPQTSGFGGGIAGEVARRRAAGDGF